MWASDLIFSPGRAPQIEISGQLVELRFKNLDRLTPQDTQWLAEDLMDKNEHAIGKLGARRLGRPVLRRRGRGQVSSKYFSPAREYCDCHACNPRSICTFEDLHLPPQLKEIVQMKNGIVLVTGPTGSGSLPLSQP